MNHPFPTIRTLSDVLPHIENKPEILVKPGPHGSTVACYQFQDTNTFDNAFAAECRGLVFDRTGRIVGRPLHKFFNLGERPASEPDLGMVVRVMDKRDGSMIHTVWLEGQLLLKSKKCFDNAQTAMATEWLNRAENKRALGFCKSFAEAGFTVIFELTSPANRIVVDYDITDMRLLHIRDNVTGEYMSGHDLDRMVDMAGLKLADEGMSLAAALESLPELTDAEGYVFQFENGDMVKAKCPWYLNLHRTISFTRERDIAEAALEGRLDDIKSALSFIGIDLAAVNAIESRVKALLLGAQAEVAAVLSADSQLGRKEFAVKHKGHTHFGMLMAAYVGAEPDFKLWFRRNVLKDFTLEPVGAPAVED